MLTGGCFCGTVRYEISTPLVHAQACHCSRCRKVFSGASSAFARLSSSDAFRWVAGEDNVQTYESQKGGGLGFCKTCGSTLCGMYNGNVMGVTLGTINGDPGIEIARHIYVGSKAPWDHIGGDAPQFDESPD